MKKCVYCGCENEDERTVCSHCFAEFPHEEETTSQKPVRRAAKKLNKESED